MSDKKIAIVTGATQGIGLAIARKLCSSGYFVIGTHVRDYDAASLAALVESNFILKQVDASDFKQCELFAKGILAEYGTIHALVNNAGIVDDGLMLSMTHESFTRVLDVNLTGAFNMTKVFTRSFFKACQGSVVNISSVIGLIGNAGQANYAASKAGLIGFSKSLAREFASRNIRVNCVAPGFIETDMTKKLPEASREAILNQIALKQFGQVEDVADAVSFLMSDQARYITGQTLNVCGGLVI